MQAISVRNSAQSVPNYGVQRRFQAHSNDFQDARSDSARSLEFFSLLAPELEPEFQDTPIMWILAINLLSSY